MKTYDLSQPVSFRSFVPWLVLKNVCLVLIGLFCAMYAMRIQPIAWIGTASSLLGALLLWCHHTTNQVILQDYTLIEQTGLLARQQRFIPVGDMRLTIDQSWLGRICNYGTIYDTTTLTTRLRIANLQSFCTELCERQRAVQELSAHLNTAAVRASTPIPARWIAVPRSTSMLEVIDGSYVDASYIEVDALDLTPQLYAEWQR